MAQVHSVESNDSYTVVIFRGSTAKPLRFSFPRKFVRKILILGAIVLLADILVVSHYVVRTGEVWELSAFRAEALSARQQTAAFSTAVDDLKKRLSSMKEVNQRLRVMLGIETPKTGDQLTVEAVKKPPCLKALPSIPRTSRSGGSLIYRRMRASARLMFRRQSPQSLANKNSWLRSRKELPGSSKKRTYRSKLCKSSLLRRNRNPPGGRLPLQFGRSKDG